MAKRAGTEKTKKGRSHSLKKCFLKGEKDLTTDEDLLELLLTYTIKKRDVRLHEDYNAIFYSMAKKQSIGNPLNPDLPKIVASVQDYQARHHFFHWPLEFPDVFPDENSSFIIPNSSFKSGFSATVGVSEKIN